MNSTDRLNLSKLVDQNNVADNTSDIRQKKHSKPIRNDVNTLLRLRSEHASGLLSKTEYDDTCSVKCQFLFTYYTDIFNKIKKSEIARHTGSFSREKNILYGLNLPYDRFFFNSSYEDCVKPNNIVKRVLLFGDVSFIHNPLTVDNDIFRDTVSYLFNNKLMYAAGNSDYLIL